MGLATSWPILSLLHVALVRLCDSDQLPADGPWETPSTVILGDDLLAKRPQLWIDCYHTRGVNLGFEFSASKHLIG